MCKFNVYIDVERRDGFFPPIFNSIKEDLTAYEALQYIRQIRQDFMRRISHWSKATQKQATKITKYFLFVYKHDYGTIRVVAIPSDKMRIHELNQYQDYAVSTSIATEITTLPPSVFYALGISGESGELCEKFKKLHRDKKGNLTLFSRHAIAKELGDVLWYIANEANELGFTLQEIAEMNQRKIEGRFENNLIHGEGDDRENNL